MTFRLFAIAAITVCLSACASFFQEIRHATYFHVENGCSKAVRVTALDGVERTETIVAQGRTEQIAVVISSGDKPEDIARSGLTILLDANGQTEILSVSDFMSKAQQTGDVPQHDWILKTCND